MLDRTSRRRFLAGTAAATIVGAAGCLGDDDAETINLAVPPSGTVSNRGVSALQRAVSQESDSIDLRIEETSGDPESIREFDAGGVGAHTSGLSIMMRARDGREPFEDDTPESFADQVFNYAALHHYFVAVEGSGLETFDDIVEQADDLGIYILPPGWGLRRLAEDVLQEMGVFDEIQPSVVDLETSEVAGAVEEGRIDALLVYGANFVNNPGWVQEVDARNDVFAVEATDTWTSGLEASAATNPIEMEPYGWDQDVGLDEVVAYPESFSVYAGDSISSDGIYELCRVSHEHIDVVHEADESYLDHSDVNQMTAGLSGDLPYHEGAEQFYEEYGADMP